VPFFIFGRKIVSTVALVEESQASEEVAAIYADIRATLGMPFVPAMFKAIAHHPAYLRASWERVKIVMGPGLIDRKTKEMIAVAVSAANGCDYCVQAHTAALRGMGSRDAEIVELMAVVDLFSGFNKMLEGLQVASDIGVAKNR
jgi:AhpD family alkylhydroperoxidase